MKGNSYAINMLISFGKVLKVLQKLNDFEENLNLILTENWIKLIKDRWY